MADGESLTVLLSKCPLCGGTQFKELHTPGHWIGQKVFAPVVGKLKLVRCGTCGLRFISP